MGYSYTLEGVVYILSENDPMKDRIERDLKRRDELYNLLKQHCRESKFIRTGLFGGRVEFYDCDIDIPDEKGETYELRGGVTMHLDVRLSPE